jgi:hypothetical protein
MRLVRISFTPKRVLRKAGISAQSAPPRMPSAIMAGSTQGPAFVLCVASASQPPKIAPITNWPSAPMFQRFARKQ